MKIGGLQKFTLSDFPGKCAAIVFTQGCNFRCPFCHNGRLIALDAPPELSIEEKDIFYFLNSRKKQIDGVVISGGEPTIQKDLPLFCAKIKKIGLSVKLDTNGSRPDVLEDLLRKRLLDYVAMDIKASYANYSLLSGVPVDIKSIKKSISVLKQANIPVLFRTTWVEGLHQKKEKMLIKEMIPDNMKHIFQETKLENVLNPEVCKNKNQDSDIWK